MERDSDSSIKSKDSDSASKLILPLKTTNTPAEQSKNDSSSISEKEANDNRSSEPIQPVTESDTKDCIELENTVKQNKIMNDAKPVLMTRRELTDPFGSDDEDQPPANGSETKNVLNRTSKSPENNININGNGGDDSPKEEFTNMPKVNPVSLGDIILLLCMS